MLCTVGQINDVTDDVPAMQMHACDFLCVTDAFLK